MPALQTLRWEMKILTKKQKKLEDENGHITNMYKYLKLTKTMAEVRHAIEFFEKLGNPEDCNV